MTDIAEETLTRSTGNVFADLDLPDPAVLAIKSTLLGALQGAIDGPDAAAILANRVELHKDEAQAIAGGEAERWTVDGLVGLLDRLGLRVAVRVLDATGTLVLEREIVPAPPTADRAPGRRGR